MNNFLGAVVELRSFKRNIQVLTPSAYKSDLVWK